MNSYNAIKFKRWQSPNIVRHKLIKFLVKHHPYMDEDYLFENAYIANYIDEIYVTIELGEISFNNDYRQFIIAIMDNDTGKWRVENNVLYGENY